MAGLQQYNFFPTDLFYPRPQPQPSSTKPTVLPLQTSNSQDQQQQQQQQPRSSIINNATPSTTSLVFNQKSTHFFGAVHNNKLPNFSSDPLSWVVWMAEDEDDGSLSS